MTTKQEEKIEKAQRAKARENWINDYLNRTPNRTRKEAEDIYEQIKDNLRRS